MAAAVHEQYLTGATIIPLFTTAAHARANRLVKFYATMQYVRLRQ